MVLRRTWVGGVALGAALWVSEGATAHAQSADLTTRRLLIEQGQQASQAGDHALAVQRAEAAMAIQETPSLRLFYARELVAVQRPADAFAQAEACVREVDRDASVPNRDALLQGCRTIAQDTRSAIGMLTVTVRGERPRGVRITVGGRPLAEALIGVPSAVNPGRVVVDGGAPGYRDTHREVDVARGGNESIELELEVDPHAVTGRGGEGLGGDTRGQGGEGGAPRESYRTRPVSIGAVVVTAVGGAALASSGLFFALRQGGFGPCTVVNGSAQCPTTSDAMTLSDNAGRIELMNTLTNAALIGGTVVLAGGVAWLVADRVTSRERVTTAGRTRAPSVAVSVDGRGASVFVGGAF